MLRDHHHQGYKSNKCGCYTWTLLEDVYVWILIIYVLACTHGEVGTPCHWKTKGTSNIKNIHLVIWYIHFFFLKGNTNLLFSFLRKKSCWNELGRVKKLIHLRTLVSTIHYEFNNAMKKVKCKGIYDVVSTERKRKKKEKESCPCWQKCRVCIPAEMIHNRLRQQGQCYLFPLCLIVSSFTRCRKSFNSSQVSYIHISELVSPSYAKNLSLSCRSSS